MNPFANTLRRLRTNRRMRQKELARYLNLDASSICQLESGRRGPLSKKQLEQLAVLLDLNSEEEEQLLVDARISSPIRKVRTDVDRDRLLVLDALMERLEVLTDDQIEIIGRVINMRIATTPNRRGAASNEGGKNMNK